MRKNTKTILWITVIAFVALMFFVWGAETRLGCGGVSQGVIGRVNGEAINLDYFNRIYQANRENFRTSRGSDPGPGDEAMMQQQTWNSIIEQMLLVQEVHRQGLAVSDDEIRYAARNNPPPAFQQSPAFQTNGQFDIQKYQAVLNNPNVDPQFFTQLEGYLRETLPIEKLTSLVYGTAVVSDAEVKQLFLDRSEQARVSYRLFDLRSYNLPAPVTDSEAQAYFKAHPDEFNLPAQATVHYVRIDRKPTDADREAIRQQLDDYATMARRYAQGDTTAQSFAMLAETYSELPSATQGGLNPKFVAKGELTPEIETVAFALPAGAVSNPILDRQGFHLIQVDSIMTDATGPKVRLRDMMLKVEPSDATLTDLESRLKNLKEAAVKKGLDVAAKAQGLTVVTPPAFNESGYIRGLESVPGVVEWAFRSKPGAMSTFPTNDAWFEVTLVSSLPKGKAAYKDVVELARQKATESKQRELARKDAEAFVAKVGPAPSWRAAAGSDSAQVRVVGPFSRASGVPGIGRDPEVLAAAYSLPVGQPSKPIDATRGVVVLRVEERKPADESQFAAQKPQLAQQLTSQRRTEVYQDWLKDLKTRAVIKDFRDLYFKS